MSEYNPTDTTCVPFLSNVYQFERSDVSGDIVGFVPDYGWLTPNRDRSFANAVYVVVLEEKIASDTDTGFSQTLYLRRSAIKAYLALAAELTVQPAFFLPREIAFGPGLNVVPAGVRLECIRDVEQRVAEGALPRLAAC